MYGSLAYRQGMNQTAGLFAIDRLLEPAIGLHQNRPTLSSTCAKKHPVWCCGIGKVTKPCYLKLSELLISQTVRT